MYMTEKASGLVLAAKLETQFLTGCVKHYRTVSELSTHEAQNPLEEVWNVEPVIGRGTFGTVRTERRLVADLSHSHSHLPHVRAVKEISKMVQASKKWNYMKELEAIVKFS